MPEAARLVATLRASGTQGAFGHLMLADDPRYRRLSRVEQHHLVAAAVADGAELAATAIARWSNDPHQLTQALHLAVQNLPDDSGYGTTKVFADYSNRLMTIRLYWPAITYLNRGLADPAWQDWLGITDATPVLIAHEIYHHLDTIRGACRLVRRYPVAVFRLGAWQWMTPMLALTEIAAGSFAQRLLNLPAHAKCLDFAALHLADADHALRMAARLSDGDAAASPARALPQ